MHYLQDINIKPSMKMANLISGNPSLLILMEHFDLDFIVHDKTIEQLCRENTINEDLFISFCDLYNGKNTLNSENYTESDIENIIRFLKNTHNFYKNEKYIEIKGFIEELYQENNLPEVQLIGKFFDEYMDEVLEHLAYEDQTVFPYINHLLEDSSYAKVFSVKEYKDHHTDIESKLADLKSLLLKHIPLKERRSLRKKLLFSLSEFEYDLAIHSLIEDNLLVPLVMNLESKYNLG